MPARFMPLVVTAVAFAAALAACGGSAAPDASPPAGPPPSLQRAPRVQVVSLTDLQASELGIGTETVALAEAPFAVELPGLAEPSPDDFAAVTAPIAGRVVEVRAHEGERVRQGQVVALLESMEFAGLVADLVQAEAEAALQQQQVERYAQLVAERISPQARLDQARADAARAGAMVQAARARLGAVGVGEAAARQAAAGGKVRVPVVAPRAGTVDRHSVVLGGAVAAYDEMMTLVGSREVMVRGQATPEQAALLHPGDRVDVGATDDTTWALAARVTSIAPAADAASRAVAIYVRVPAGQGVRPGQSVRLRVHARSSGPRLTIPLSAIVYDGDRATVYVARDSRTFVQRAVTLGAPEARRVPVLEGLREGERIATSHVFDLKALGRFEAYGEE